MELISLQLREKNMEFLQNLLIAKQANKTILHDLQYNPQPEREIEIKSLISVISSKESKWVEP
jgi:hypothetical protein